jgi:hypothetical protein
MKHKYLARPIGRLRSAPAEEPPQITAGSLTALLAAVAAKGVVPLYELYKVTEHGDLVSLGKGASMGKRGRHDQPSRRR